MFQPTTDGDDDAGANADEDIVRRDAIRIEKDFMMFMYVKGGKWLMILILNYEGHVR